MSTTSSTQEVSISNGQCGMCAHFAEHHPEAGSALTKIRKMHKAPADRVEECGHPMHAPLHLKVNAASGCDGFVAVQY